MTKEELIVETGEGQLVTFSLSGEELAFPIGLVQEIVRPPVITKVPNTPSYMNGIANLRGSILPVINLRQRLGMDSKEMDDSTRVVVLDCGGTSTGIIVDSVSEVLHIDDKIIEVPPKVVAGIEGQYLRGVAKIGNGNRLVMILDADMLIPAAMGATGAKGTTAKAGRTGMVESKALEEEELMVTFRLAEEEFAIDIMQVQEIIRVTEITTVPKAPDFIKGVMSLRNRLLPIMDLRTRFGLEADETASAVGGSAAVDDDEIDARRIVVLDLDGVLTGIQVDSVSEVMRLPKSSIELPPAIINSEDASRLKGVGKLNKGERLLMLLDAARLLSDEERQEVAATAGSATRHELKAAQEIDDEAQLVCFHVAHEEYGIDIMRVQEIIRIEEITTVPKAPDFVEGIVNLRGNVLPVIDMRTRFNLEKGERTEQNRIVVLSIQGRTTGVIVDSVSEVLRMAKKDIEPPPSVLSGSSPDKRFIDGLGKLNKGKRIIILLNVDSILSGEEGLELMELAADTPAGDRPGEAERSAAAGGKEKARSGKGRATVVAQ
ncbi:chemotaxis protein CheW [Megalodesulfovibrio gigas]|uniref:Putative CheW protein n=1 Tax=Megalodesulfovibrio gigas (strain ATCC 19364 / DSM 1382 / NCIMB 9332 / VKM B-1759) TaxID=1121448 RepID=T2GF81_MEGG1|nr:chemotaxis protein CheW [Megalodesulfovibrio gigas]AGW14953.1 putative CheW protein [Megalodesulfovibrio gigas DSM 1382 = ATCC 19364]